MWARPSFTERMLAREAERQRQRRQAEIDQWWAEKLDHIRGHTELFVILAAAVALWPWLLYEFYRDREMVVKNVKERILDIWRTL